MIALLVGTRKGAFVLTSDRSRTNWTTSEPMFLGHIAQHVVLDPHNGRRMLAGLSTGHLGPTVFRSDDLGATWTEARRPPAFGTGEPSNAVSRRCSGSLPDIRHNPTSGTPEVRPTASS